MKKILSFLKKHKVISVIIILAIASGGYWAYNSFFKKPASARYVTAAVSKGTIVSSLSESGQISAKNQINIQAKASGEVTYVGVTVGQTVTIGQLLFKLDSTNAQDAVQTAKDNLAQAQTNLKKMQGITTDVGTLRGAQQIAQDNLNADYNNGFDDVSNAFLGLPTVMTGLQNILLGYNYSSGSWNMDYYVNAVKDYDLKVTQYRDDAYAKYQAARTSYDQTSQEYKSTSRSSDTKTIETLISDAYNTANSISDAVKSANNLIQFYQDTLTTRGYTPQTLSNTHSASLNTYTGNTNNFISNLLSAKNSIQSDKEALIETSYTLTDQQNTVQNLQNALQQAEDTLANYTIYSPADGIISAVNTQKGNTASGTLATLVSQQQIAIVSLNEVDAAQVKLGQKATITFSAIDGLDITGKVIQIDTVGTVSQGVVSYSVQLSLDTQDDRVKPGMTVSASIITNAAQDVLSVPTAAIKTTNGQSIVQVVDSSTIATDDKSSNSSTTGVILKTAPKQQIVTTGISDDTSTQILSGLNEGDTIVIRTISGSATTGAATTGASRTTTGTTTRIGGGGGGFGGVRIPGL